MYFEVMSKDYFKLICDYADNNPYWLWDLVTEPYAMHEFVAEVTRELKPSDDDEAMTIERFAKRYVQNLESLWQTMSREQKTYFAKGLEKLGLDIDYDLIGEEQ